MLEIEQKYRFTPTEQFEFRLAALNARQLSTHTEIDHYFNGVERNFSQTSEAFRIRCIGEENRLTYKGPKVVDQGIKIREEIEFTIESGQAGMQKALKMLKLLGFRFVGMVKKIRHTYSVHYEEFDVLICLDDCEQVGQFIELEILAEEASKSRAVHTLKSMVEYFELTEHEPRSYLRMLLDQAGVQR